MLIALFATLPLTAKAGANSQQSTPNVATQAADRELYLAYNADNDTWVMYYDTEMSAHEGAVAYAPSGFGSSSGKKYEGGNLVLDASMKNYYRDDAQSFFSGINPKSISGFENISSANFSQNLYMMFGECSNLEKLDLSSFDTSGATIMYAMFADCSKLQTLDLSSFNTANVTDMSLMFMFCYALKTIYVGEKFVTSSVYESNGMFIECTNLQGYAAYDSNKTDATMANYITGYFKAYVTHGGRKEDLDSDGENLHLWSTYEIDGYNNSFKINAPFKTYEAYFNRNLNKDGVNLKWGTLCLPFAFDKDIIENVFHFYTYSGISNSNNVPTIILNEVEQIEAGTPVFYYNTNETSDFEISIMGENIDVVAHPVDNESDAHDGYYLYGTFDEEPVESGYVLMNNSMWDVERLTQQSGSTVSTKPFRAYLKPAAGGGGIIHFGSSQLNFPDESTTTGINAVESLDMLNQQGTEIYDLNGRKQNGLKHGVNIVRGSNGKAIKVLVK